jgi:DNA-binding CsgD family transcriptional regulator
MASVTTVAAQQFRELLERESELSVIGNLVAGASAGVGRALLVEGEAGVGKTRLLEAVAELGGDQAVLVLRARGGELERSFPFGVAAQLLSPVLAPMASNERRELLSGAAALAAPVVDPTAVPAGPTAGAEDALFARMHGLYWLSAALAGRMPLVIVVDDAHWADEPSLHWLLFLARRLEDMPVSLVLAARPAKAGDWPAPLSLLTQEPQVAVIRPQPLSESASAVVVRSLLDANADEIFCRACHQAAAGNPFYLRELVTAISADGIPVTEAGALQLRSLAPEAIGRSLLVRLGRMPLAVAKLARCVAVLGADGDLRVAARLAGLGLDDAITATDALVAAGLLETGSTLRLAHPVVRTALYAELPEGERAQLHRHAARILADQGAGPDVVAAHLLATYAHADEWTVDALGQAADRALARGAPAIAAAYLRRALEEPPTAQQRVSVLRRLGVAGSLAGDLAAEEPLHEAMRLAGDPLVRAEIALELSSAYVLTGRFGEAVRVLDEATERVAHDDQELRWRLAARLIGTARMESAYTELANRHLLRLPGDVSGATHGERLVLAHRAIGSVMAGDDVNDVVRLATAALRDGLLAEEETTLSASVLMPIFALVLSEQHELAMQAFNQLLARARREGTPVAFAFISSMRSQLHYYQGSIPDAIADARTAIDSGSHFGWTVGVPSLYANLANGLLEEGDIPGAERTLASSGVGEEIPDMLLFCDLLRSRGRLRLALGNTQAGIDDLLAGHELLARFRIANPAGMYCRSTAAVALAGLGRRDEGQELVAAELAAARRFGAPGAIGICLRAAGVVEGSEAGIELLREAVGHLERSPARLEHARALADLGASLRRGGKRQEARQALRQALDLADRCGGRVVADRALAELRIAGARPRRAHVSGINALTASERRVAQLAAEGLTNRQIAQALFVSHPTVVTHLSHCYQKLGINSREQLAAVLVDEAGSDTH